jgi:hypothetical protein
MINDKYGGNIYLNKTKYFCGFLLWFLFVFLLVNYIFKGMNKLPYSPDSWGYWELSKTIFSGEFYKVHAIRQFQIVENHAMSFPPLWPIVIAVSDRIVQIGPAVMAMMAGLFTILSAILLEVAFRVHFNLKNIGVLGGLILLADPSFVSEITAGRSIPLGCFLTSGLFYLWLSPSSLFNSLKIGALAGLLILTRFDSLPFVLLFGVAFYIKQAIIYRGGLDFKHILIYYLTVIIILSPYIFYSLEFFNTFLASDNSIVAKSAYKIFTTYYSVYPLVTIFDEPLVWLERIVFNFFSLIVTIKLIITIAVIDGFSLIFIKKFNEEDFKMKLTVVFLITYLFSFSSYILSGYYDTRYFSFYFMFLVLFNVIYFRKLVEKYKYTYLLMPSVFLCLFIFLGSHSEIYTASLSPMSLKEKIYRANLDTVPRCYERLDSDAKVMFSSASRAGLVSSYFNIYTTRVPSNFKSLSATEKQEFLSKYSVKAYYGSGIDTLFREGDGFYFEVCEFDSNVIYINKSF